MLRDFQERSSSAQDAQLSAWPSSAAHSASVPSSKIRSRSLQVIFIVFTVLPRHWRVEAPASGEDSSSLGKVCSWKPFRLFPALRRFPHGETLRLRRAKKRLADGGLTQPARVPARAAA